MHTKFDPGDWVSGFRSGYFRVERVIRCFYDESHEGGVLGEHQVGDEFDDPMLVMKRGFNSKLQRSFGWDTCSAWHCRPLPLRVQTRIANLLRRDAALQSALDAFVIPPIPSLHNIGLGLESVVNRSRVEKIIPFVRPGRVFREIAAKMNELGITEFQRFPHDATLQLVNYDFETIDKRLVFREARVISVPT